ncbi:Ser/Thr protein kinase RdoA involved in Cpx stress response, MazF antagonist [Oceanobacillus limi]|uniref:Ser/Thr protein kinase RdoA involved in Cpx stress response, MazF antagonist n=1 Tax=Oceanobacillus limi TaxID=930131 RepID=A0A1H9Y6J6_9BACI|nr:phosphotransferase [Oceanobacillus limi]SES64346.1 Ser/Thr protein kinase RdoA involved in Cpx stress response, MazF antagonist [Oceanobacillus limi]
MAENKILEKLNEQYLVDFTKVEPVTDEMFRCTAKQGTYFARITNYKTEEEQVEEVNYTNFLYNSGLGVSPTIPSRNGKLVEKIPLPNNKEVLTVLYQAAPGIHAPMKQWNANIFKNLGRQIGKLHRLSKQYESTHQVKNIHDWHKNEEYDFFKYIPKEEKTIRDLAGEVLSSIEKIPKDNENYGLIHGDLWLENILVDEEQKLTMIDFQDCEKHFYLYDLVVPIYSAMEFSFAGNGNIDDYGRSITKAIFAGYEEENTISPEMLDRFPLFVKLKEIFDYSLMHMYWDKANLTEEQVRILNLYRIRIEKNLSFIHL